MSSKPQTLQIGKFQIPEPCSVPWDEMDSHVGGNRYCRACNKVVHDLTGMSLGEIAGLYRQSGGNLCGSFAMDEDEKPIYFINEAAPKKTRYLKHLAVAASMILLYQAPQASSARDLRNKEAVHLPSPEATLRPIARIAPEVTTETNTLLSGLILTQDSVEIHDDLVVEVYAKGMRVAHMNSTTALFHHDFAGKLKPTDKIKIMVLSKTFDFGKKYQERKYIGSTIETTLGNAQNVRVAVQFTPPKHPPRRGGRMRIITDI